MPLRFNQKSQREQPPAGSQAAIIDGVIDLGSQTTSYGLKPQVLLRFQLTDKRASDGRPFSLNRFYNFTNHQNSALRGDLEAVCGRAADIDNLDLDELIGTTCTVEIVHVERGGRLFANIVGVRQRANGAPTRMPCDGGTTFSLSDEPFNQSGFDALPEWVRRMIEKSPEYRGATGSSPPDTAAAPAYRPPTRDELDDEIPF